VETNANWNKRYQENMLRLKSGDLYEVARVIKSLMHRDMLRGLSTGERKMLHNARQIMLSEIVLVEACDYKEIESKLDCAMMQVAVSQ
jgi:CarD family transcriptional regulator